MLLFVAADLPEYLLRLLRLAKEKALCFLKSNICLVDWALPILLRSIYLISLANAFTFKVNYDMLIKR